MVFDLIKKESLLFKGDSSKKTYIRLISFLLKAVFIGLFIALEVYIFLSLDKKIGEYSTYGIFDFLVLFLFIMFIISIISSLFSARKMLFSKKDSEILLPLPISSGEIIFSKVLYLYAKEVILNLVISTPLLITFGASRTFIPYFYVFSIIYPLLISILIVGVSLTFVVPFEYLYNFLKKYDIVQFILASIVVILLCFVYKYVLDVFLTALNDSSFGGVFSDDFVNTLHKIANYLFPISGISRAVVYGENVLSSVCIFIGETIIFLLLGINLASYFYNKMNKVDYYKTKEKSNKKNKEIRVLNLDLALIKKEFTLLFKDNSYVFSYTSLLIMMPFLSFVVISSLNGIIYENLKVFAVYFPELTNGISLTLILLFISVINANASLSISREEKGVEIIKYIPVDPFKQIVLKLIAPISLSSISLIISEIVLVSTKTINWYIFLVSLIIGLCLIIFSNVFGILADMRDKSSKKTKIKYLTSLISIVYPFIILIIHFILSFVKCPTILIYLVEVILSIILVLPLFIKVKTRINNLFRLMEVN